MIILAIFVMIGVFFLSGVVMQKLLKLPFSFTHAVMTGCLTLMSVFHVITYPMIRMSCSFSLLFFIYSGILLVFITSSCLIFRKKESRACCIARLSAWKKPFIDESPFILLVFGLSVFFLILSLGYSYDNSDYSYYLPRTMEMISQNNLGVAHGYSWCGFDAQSIPENVDASTLEAWHAYWSHLFGLHPTIFCHTSLSIVIYIVSWCILYQVYFSISQAKSKSSFFAFLLVYLLLFIADASSYGSAPYWVVYHPSQGKSLLLSIIQPALIYACSEIVACGKKHIPWQKWFFLSLAFTAGIASTVIGVFWPFLCCLMMGLPYLLIERRKDLHKLILPLLLACLPVIFYAGISYLSVVTEQPRYLEIELPNWQQAFITGLNPLRMNLLFPCTIFVMALGSKQVKLIWIGGTVCLYATLVNPTLMSFVSKYLSTGSVYYRLFWITPIYYLSAYVCSTCFESISLKIRRILGVLLMIVIGVYGVHGVIQLGPKGLIFDMNTKLDCVHFYQGRHNIYGLSDFWYESGKQLLNAHDDDERIRVFWLGTEDCFYRQYSERIELVGACRPKQMVYFDQPLGTATAIPSDLAAELKGQDNLDEYEHDPQWLYEQLVASEIDYICIDNSYDLPLAQAIPSGFEFVDENARIRVKVYRVLPSQSP